MELTNETMQRARRDEFAAKVRELLRPMLKDNAEAPKLLWWDQARVALWASHAFFLGDDQDVVFANVILRYIRDILKQPVLNGNPRPFENSALAGLLAVHGERMEPDTLAWAEETLRALMPAGMTADFQFHGYNDNMPVMFTWTWLYGGQRFGDARAVDVGRANLLQLRDLLRRRGTVAEYGVNYSTHRLTGIAHIVDYVQDAELAGIARDIEARLWAELAGHYQARLGVMGGAAMRGGSPWQSETPCLLRHVFGDDIMGAGCSWLDYLTEKPRLSAVELGFDPDEYLHAYMFGYGAEFTSAVYHVPKSVAALFYEKPAGFQMRCTSEQGYVNQGVFCEHKQIFGQGGLPINVELGTEEIVIPHYPDNGAQPHAITSYHGRNFLLGTSTTNQFPSSHAFRCTFARHEPMRSPADRGEVFVRYNLNEKVQGGRMENLYRKTPDRPGECSGNYCTLIHDDGRHHTLQHGPTALCLQVPRPLEAWDIRSMRTDVLLYQEGAERTSRIFVDDAPIDSLPYEGHDGLITIDEGAVFLALVPIIGRHAARECALRIHAVEDYTVFSLYNYQGPSIEMTHRDMSKLGNGFLFEIRDAQDVASFEAFQAEVRETRVLDRLAHGTRRVHAGRPGLRLSMDVCPYANTVKCRAVNAREDACPPFEYSDGRQAGLPFLDGQAVDGFADWDWLETQLTRPLEDYNVQD